MRLLVCVIALAALSSCTCAGCQRGTALDAGTPTTSVAAVLGASLTAVEEGPTEPTDAAIELSYKVIENAPSHEALLAAYTANCRAQVEISFEDMDGTHPDAGECDARMFEQNCSPDTFGCWEGVEKCRDACASPCHTCQSVCADRCEACKTRCDGGTCITQCAQSRFDCRVQCLAELEACRTTTCEAAMRRCDAEAHRRLKRLCPDCEAIMKCELEVFEKDQDVKTCSAKYPNNAAECIDWCSPGE